MTIEEYNTYKRMIKEGTLTEYCFPLLYEYYKDMANPIKIHTTTEFNTYFKLYLNTPIFINNQIIQPSEELYKKLNKIFNHLDNKYYGSYR